MWLVPFLRGEGRTMPVLEEDVEREFVRLMCGEGWTVLKFTPMGSRGWPDRMVVLPGGRPVFVELKRPGKEPTELQKQRIKDLRKWGYPTRWFDDAKKAARFVKREAARE